MAENNISNGDFENGDSDWSFTSNGSGVKTDNEDVATTNTFCSISSTESVAQNLGVTSGKSYTISLKSRSNLVTGTVAIITQGTVDHLWEKKFNNSLSSEWVEEKFNVTIDSKWEAPLVLHISADWVEDTTLTVDIDDVTMTEDV